ncbi:MAG TPA: alpha/beta hydrolase [Candidatus Nitrosotalea sp.]|nr:alpha/beta hydrolase [Candidatus Nitrosotalea sp.]
MQVLTDDGARIDAIISGKEHDDAVVLIHGFPLTRDIWKHQADALARSFCAVRPDLRGAGTSSSTEGPYLMERLAGDVAALLDALGIGRAAMIGHSMGGYVAMAFARMFGERVTRLALVASRLRADTPDEAAAREMLAARIEREGSIEPLVEAYLPRLLGPQTAQKESQVVERAYEIARANAVAGAVATLRGIALRPTSEDIAEDLDLPVMVIAGAQDRVVPLEEARAMAARFPHASFVTCAQSGHLPMMEEPAFVTETLLGWLSA